MDEMTEIRKAGLWCYGALAQLTNWGLVGGTDRMTGKGHEIFLELQDAGWKPTNEHLEFFTRDIINCEDILPLLKKYRDNPQAIKAFVDSREDC